MKTNTKNLPYPSHLSQTIFSFPDYNLSKFCTQSSVSFPCEIQAQKVNGVKLASCYGPVMESPFNGDYAKVGQTAITQAPEGSTYSVSGNIEK